MRRWIEELGGAWRSLTGGPMVSLLSIMTLALGIGATEAIFTVLNGLLAGSLAALAIGGILHGMFYGIRPADPLVFVAAAALLLGVAMLASYFPARHAARTKPVEALRRD